MAKKEKKQKKSEKKEKGKKKKKKEEQEFVPYAGSDKLKTMLAYLIISLCLAFLVLAIHTIRLYRQSGAMTLGGASSSLSARASSSAPASSGQIWYTMPDGTFVQG